MLLHPQVLSENGFTNVLCDAFLRTKVGCSMQAVVQAEQFFDVFGPQFTTLLFNHVIGRKSHFCKKTCKTCSQPGNDF